MEHLAALCLLPPASSDPRRPYVSISSAAVAFALRCVSIGGASDAGLSSTARYSCSMTNTCEATFVMLECAVCR